MGDVTVLEDSVDAAWQRRVRWMAVTQAAFEDGPRQIPAQASVKIYQDNIRLWHLDASWPARELLRIPLPSLGAAEWTVMAWHIGTAKVGRAMLEAGEAWALLYGIDPPYAFIRNIPQGAEQFVELGGICLLSAEWVPEGFLAVGAGGMWRKLSHYEKAVMA